MSSELDRAILALRQDPDNGELQRKVNKLARESVTRFYRANADEFIERSRK